MKSKLENKLSMAKAVQNALQMHNSVINLVPAYSAARTELDGTITEIDGLVQVQQETTEGISKDKQEAEEKAISAAVKLAGPVKSYAIAENNNALLETVNITPSKLKKMRDTDLLNALGAIKNNVAPIASSLVGYGVTPAQLTEYDNAVADYASLVQASRTQVNIRAQATEQLNSTFQKMDAILQRLDGFADMQKDSEPEFYLTYKNARTIVDNAASVGEGSAGNGGGGNATGS